MTLSDLKHSRLIVLLILPISMLFTCIERVNPWDPINGCPRTFRDEIRKESIQELQSGATDASGAFQKIIEQSKHSDSLRNINDFMRRAIFEAIQLSISVDQENSVIDSKNKTADCNKLHLKSAIKLISYAMPFSIVLGNLKDLRSSISRGSNSAESIFFKDNNKCPPFGIHPDWFQDSVMHHFDTLIAKTDSIINLIDSWNIGFSEDSISKIDSLNNVYATKNLLTLQYNDSIENVMYYCGKPWLSDPQSIKSKIDSLQPGDTLFLDSGALDIIELKLLGKGDTIQPIVIEGSPFSNTVVNQQMSIFLVDGCINISIRNITFNNGRERNCAVTRSKKIRFDHCNFINSVNGIGLDISNSNVDVDSCTFVGNRIGIVNSSGPNGIFRVNNVLIAHNSSHGLQNVESELSLFNATISDNGGTGIYLANPKNTIFIAKTLLTYNKEYGFFRERSEDDKIINMLYVAFFDNTMGNLSADSSKISIDVSWTTSEPMYVDKDGLNYTIGSNSELYLTDIGYKP